MADEPQPDRRGGSKGEDRRRGESKRFDPETLDTRVIALPLYKQMESRGADYLHEVIIDLNLNHPGGRDGARQDVMRLVESTIGAREAAPGEVREGIDTNRARNSRQYLYASLRADTIREIVRRDGANDNPKTGDAAPGTWPRAIYHLWPDFEIDPLITTSVRTVKADASRTAFGTSGEGIVWAVVDSGVDSTHPHFARHQNLDLPEPLEHRDYTANGTGATVDELGHGTHVAGIIAGEGMPDADGTAMLRPDPAKANGKSGEGAEIKALSAAKSEAETRAEAKARAKAAKEALKLRAMGRHHDEGGNVTYAPISLDRGISGIAPRCQILSLKVLNDKGKGRVSYVLDALEYIQELNGNGRRLRVHGVNLSVGYDFEPEWFACGQSPLCVEVDRLVHSGVAVVVAAGNTGYGWANTQAKGNVAAGMSLTINDPGNAEQAITVGSTHREMPHIYGVSYFSSKGPTGDGRLKPDLVAPGEKILSCAAGKKLQDACKEMKAQKLSCVKPDYIEDSGTSMAAPHVSGSIAAFLSVRREFIGQPQRVKEVFLSTATDLKREKYFQGHGLVDLMRAIQSV